VSSTITIPAGAQIVGEAWSVIAGSGNAFANQNEPQVVVRVGEKDSEGVVEITDMLFTTVGPGMLLLHVLAGITLTCILSTWSNRSGVECTTTSWA
jgi:hypothetical protein